MKVFLYAIYKYLFAIPFFGVETVFFTLCVCVFNLFGMSGAARKCGVLWARVMQFVTPMPVTVEGSENIRPGQSYVITANHQSAYDIFVIYGSLNVDFRWILKQELRDVPVLGLACEKLGHIFINRKSARVAYRSLQKAKQILVGGVSVVIFPEGHRSGAREMNPFKHGAFKMALDLELPLLPVTIQDTYKVMSGGLRSLQPGKAKLVIHPEIDIKLYEGRRDELIEEVRRAMQY